MRETVNRQAVAITRNLEISTTAIGRHRSIETLRHLEFGMILLEGRVAKNEFKEIATDGEGSAIALTEGSGAEVDAAIFTTYPGSDDEARGSAYEPSIAVIIGGSCLTTEVCIAEESAYETIKR
jgi:hypothetical protein